MLPGIWVAGALEPRDERAALLVDRDLQRDLAAEPATREKEGNGWASDAAWSPLDNVATWAGSPMLSSLVQPAQATRVE